MVPGSNPSARTKMKILIVNNHTKHIADLLHLFPGADIFKKEDLSVDMGVAQYELLVFSGGSDIPTALRHPEEYSIEIGLIKNSRVPVIGICLGAEIITLAFGGNLKSLQSEHRGLVEFKIDNLELKSFLNSDTLIAVEGHKIGIENLPKDFTAYAHSDHGIEMFKHKERPIIGFQFHLEVSNNVKLKEWVFNILGLK